jgi:quinol monooxygenase YgiN
VLVEFLVTPSFVGRSVLHEIYDNEAAFDEHLASARCRSFAAAIENEIEQRSVRRFAFSGESAEIVRAGV